jgi:hypothetical protein
MSDLPASPATGRDPAKDAASKVPPSVRKWISLVIGLSVGVALGLGPFLGKVAVPGFVPLLQLFPDGLRTTALILSSFLMGLVAVGVHYYADVSIRKGKLDRLFLAFMVACALSFFSLFFVYQSCTTVVDSPGAHAQFTFITGFGERLPSCASACDPTLSPADCIVKLGFNPAIIATCFGSSAIGHATTAMLLAYLLVMSTFGGIIGVLTYKRSK